MYEKLSKNALLNMYFGTITGTIAILAIIFVLELLFVIPNNIGILVILGLIIAIILFLTLSLVLFLDFTDTDIR